ncbi:nipped-B protein isoform X6 [Sitodiplosis mosellana]|uniref:nipped-B protein isoform X6 n=1 Tax=Sitodiplosis mosellana TaxID=263140 RepID=UPI0024442643|nr:nipped-B protein isoform X6 [Sitodiplosis mosellana]XP_055299108.1 nipped-B protein isoform X6 [Sitodiplosis mosellana]
MNDREIPSVPVTTLAGLASVSDLLSELPISESSVGTPSKKSLLFHPRVAEEANHLLSMKDDALTRQLTAALEQTNADHIELKPQYVEQQPSVTNMNELPHLLQAILQIKQNVFKTGGQQYQHQRPPQNSMQQNSFCSAGNQMQWNQQQQQQQQQQQYSAQLQSFNSQNPMMHTQQQMQYQQQLQQQQQQQIYNSQNQMMNSTQHMQYTQQIQQQQITPNQMPQPMVVKQEYPKPEYSYGNMDQRPQDAYGVQQNMYEMPQQVIPSQLHQPYQAAEQSQQQQQHHQQQQQQQQSYQSVIQNQTQPIQNVAHHQTPLGMPQQQQQQQQPLPTQQQQQQTLQQGANQNSAFDTFDSIKSAAPAQQSHANRYANNIGAQNHKLGGRPHNNDFNQQLGLVKPEMHQSYQQRTNNQLQAINEILMKSKSALNNLQKNQEHMKVFPEDPPPPPKPAPGHSSNDKKSLKIQLNRLHPEHIEQMGKSVSEFAKNSPESAKKLGVIKDEVDLFSLMKADERNLKRKPADNDVCPFSQPKLKRICQDSSPKANHEDVHKSQTYQQFVRNMENEIEHLQETEHFYNNDDVDYHNDCISKKTLNQLSSDVAKLKAKGVVDALNKNKLTLLINFAMRNVDVVKNLSAGPDIEDDSEEQIDKILDAAEACLLVCNLYSTTKDVKFLQEDNMDKIVKFAQLQMRETIFPTFDPVFSLRSTKKPDGRKKNKNHNVNNNHGVNVSRKVQLLYNKLVELTRIFVTLFDKCTFIDTIVLAVSTLAVEPFFVDNIEAMQFACLELITTIFRKETYVNYRNSILNDIFASVDRLPQSKRNMRPYKLSHNGGSIQMITALVLQLIQSSTVLADTLCDTSKSRKKINQGDMDAKFDKDVIVKEKHDIALSIGGNFLTTFLDKCKSRSSETDFRPLFENFITDLLTTVNRPEWPASELLLSLLGTLLVKYMSDKTMDQSIRVVSLEYLGIVAARLRKDTVESRCKVDTMDQLIKCIKLEQEKENDLDNDECKIVVDPEEERTEFLQRILLDFLAVNAHEDNLVYDYARHFYLTQWYQDAQQRKKRVAQGEKGFASRKKQTKKNRKYRDSESSLDDDSDDDDNVKEIKPGGTDQELNLEIFRLLDNRKKYLLSKISSFSPNSNVQDIKTYIDYNNANLIAQYLASKRPFSQSFDIYLQKIILVVREPSIGIRTKAMKCLALIVEVDPSILTRKDMQIGVSQKFLDTSISVREAAVDLVGKYVLNSPELIIQYYDMLSKRILDTGVSVRKRVIKILRDICIEYPNFTKIPEICVKMIRRVNDEEGIQKLVTEVFMRMWFTPCADNDKASIQRKINQMIDVVSMAHDTGLQWLDGLLTSIFTPKEEKDIDRTANAPKKEPPKEVVKACQQIADGLVNEILKFEASDSNKVLSCVTTLHLLAKVRPALLINHGITLEPYLNTLATTANGLKFISCIAEILEQVVPLMEHPSESFLVELETHLMVLACSHNQAVVNSCLSCLGAVINKITKNYRLIRDCFVRFYKPIINSHNQLQKHPSYPIANIYRPQFRRGLFTIGLIMRFFDFKQPTVYGEGLGPEEAGLPSTICSDTFERLFYFSSVPNHNEIRREALVALGHFCIQNYDYLVDTKLRNLYCDILTSETYDVSVKIIVLRNIQMYLNDADMSMSMKDKDWQTQSLVENLSDMNDVASGMASRIIQLYLKEILSSLLHRDVNVRSNAIKVIQLVLQQGLVHPMTIVPYLICLSTDSVRENAHRADHHLQEIDKAYPGFVHMKSQAGITLSFELQTVIQNKEKERSAVVRGYCVRNKDEPPAALNSFLYSLLRTTKPQRRALMQGIVKQFDEQKTTLRQMIYLADNLAYFPYTMQDEPLYIIHQIDLLITVAGTSLLQTFKENLKPVPGQEQNDPNAPKNILEDDDDDEDIEALLHRLPDSTIELQKCITASQGCILLLMLKQHLKDLYKINDNKISRYTPSENAKVYEKAVHRVPVPNFNPKQTIDIINSERSQDIELTEAEKQHLLQQYLDFKQLMLKIDNEGSDDDSDTAINKSATTTPKKVDPNEYGGNAHAQVQQPTIHLNNVNNAIIGNAGQTPLQALPKNMMNSHGYPTPTLATAPKSMPIRNTMQKTPKRKQSRKSASRGGKRSKKNQFRSSSEDDASDYSDDDYE